MASSDTKEIDLSPKNVKRLYNVVCPYCATPLSDANRTKEHVIGTRFVPKGRFDGTWNLIVNACASCNNIKSDLEDDISAITMQPDAYGLYPVDDDELVAESRRKAAKSASRETGKPVKDSAAQMKIDGEPMRGMSMNFSFTAPPQLDDKRAFELAHMQLMAFFFLITYQEKQLRGWRWPGEFMTFLHTRRSDWGNASWIGFMAATKEWDMRLHARTADEFFCCSIKRHPVAECWAWAIQWNHQHRLAGFLGDRAAAQLIVDGIRPDPMQSIQLGPNRHIRMRRDTPLAPEADELFPSTEG